MRAPTDANARVNFVAELEEITLEQAAPAAKVVINARTGSIVLNSAVTLGPCAIAHGNLSVTISSTPIISQPAPLGRPHGGGGAGQHHDQAGAGHPDPGA